MTIRLYPGAICVAVLLVAGAHVTKAQSLTLADFLSRVERTHPSLRAASFEPELADAEIRSALGRFDPTLDVQYEYKDKGGFDKLNVFSGALELPLDMIFGPKLKASYNRGLGSSINPETSTTLPGEASVGVVLPVLQGIFTDQRRNQLRVAMLRPDLAAAQFRLERNNLLRNAALRYWDWSESVAAVDIADSLVNLAQRRADFIGRRVRAGEAAAYDSIEIAQEVQRRIGERYRALRIAEQFAIDVSVFLWNADGTPQQFTGTPEPLPVLIDTAITTDQAVARALVMRPEIQRVDVLRQTARLDSSLASEFMRPYLELEAGLTSYDVTALTKMDYKVGLRVTQPLLFRQASAGVQRADISVQRADLTASLVARLIEADASNAVIALQRSQQRLQAAELEARLAAAMVEADQRRFSTGDATLLQVNLRERFLAEALLRVVSARAEVARSLATLRWATGTL